jgi:hypothetical protein
VLRELDLIERFVRHGLDSSWNSRIPSIRKQAGKGLLWVLSQQVSDGLWRSLPVHPDRNWRQEDT